VLLRFVLVIALIVGCAEDTPEPVDAEDQLGPALFSSALEEDGTLLLTFSKPVAQVTVDGAAATLTDGATRAHADVAAAVGDGKLDVAWSGPGGGTFREALEFAIPESAVPEPAVPVAVLSFSPVMPGGSILIDGSTFEVDAFYIAKHETTNAQYDAFVQSGDGFDNPAWWADMPAAYSPPQRGLENPRNSLSDAPRDTVSWYQAVAFTRWLNARMAAKNADISSGGLRVNGVEWEVRLPAEWEWQWAAQGGAEAREYPWGDWQEGHANTGEAGVGATTAVGSYPLGAAASGALDMSGNVWEWCLNKWDPPHSATVDATHETRVLRGGSFNDVRVLASSSFRRNLYPHGAGRFFGFRVGLFAPL